MTVNTKLDKYIQEIIFHLELSKESIYAEETPLSLIETINNYNNNLEEIKVLFLPTSPLQDIAIDNGWGDKFNIIASKIERLVL